MNRHTRSLLALAVTAGVAMSVSPVPSTVPVLTSGSAVVSAASPGAAFVPVTPCRLLDTRQGGGARVAPESTIRLQVTGRCGVSATSRAASVTVTATDASTGGFVTLFAAGSARPNASNVNFRAGPAVANSAVVVARCVRSDRDLRVGTRPCDHRRRRGVRRHGRSGGGRPFHPAGALPLDRHQNGRRGGIRGPRPATPIAGARRCIGPRDQCDADRCVRADVRDRAPRGHGAPQFQHREHRPDRTRADRDDLRSRDAIRGDHSPIASANVIVDIVGWFTGPAATPSTDGLFVATPPTRVWDSRTALDPLHAGGTLERQLTPTSVGPVAAAVVNVTAIDATRPGYLTAYPAGTPQPYVSMLNATWRDPQASMTVVSTTARGASFFASAGMHVLVDVAGYFTGPFAAAIEPVRGEHRADGRRVGPVRGRLGAVRDPLERPDRVVARCEHRPQPRIVPAVDRRVVSWERGLHADDRGHRGGDHNPECSTPW